MQETLGSLPCTCTPTARAIITPSLAGKCWSALRLGGRAIPYVTEFIVKVDFKFPPLFYKQQNSDVTSAFSHSLGRPLPVLFTERLKSDANAGLVKCERVIKSVQLIIKRWPQEGVLPDAYNIHDCLTFRLRSRGTRSQRAKRTA